MNEGTVKKYLNISRPKNYKGWRVRIRHDGKDYAKWVSDKKHGGEQGSLEAAIAWRNQLEDSFGITWTEREIERLKAKALK